MSYTVVVHRKWFGKKEFQVSKHDFSLGHDGHTLLLYTTDCEWLSYRASQILDWWVKGCPPDIDAATGGRVKPKTEQSDELARLGEKWEGAREELYQRDQELYRLINGVRKQTSEAITAAVNERIKLNKAEEVELKVAAMFSMCSIEIEREKGRQLALKEMEADKAKLYADSEAYLDEMRRRIADEYAAVHAEHMESAEAQGIEKGRKQIIEEFELARQNAAQLAQGRYQPQAPVYHQPQP